MNENLISDSLKIAQKSLTDPLKGNSYNNILLWVAIIEFVVILFLLFKTKLKQKENGRTKFKKESLKGEIDFHNIIDSSFNSNQLYDELKIKCHPDRFPTDKEQNLIAEALFQEISKNKTNIKRLHELKEEAKQKLNINF